jgi:hypothetical protein
VVVIELRELSRADEDIAHEFNRATNSLREQLYRIAPEWLTLSPAATDPWFWGILDLKRGCMPSRRVVERILKTHRIRRVTADDVVAIMERPSPQVAPGTMEATAQHVALLLPRLRLLREQRQQRPKTIEALLEELGQDEHPSSEGPEGHERVPTDVTLVRSMPGVGEWSPLFSSRKRAC